MMLATSPLTSKEVSPWKLLPVPLGARQRGIPCLLAWCVLTSQVVEGWELEDISSDQGWVFGIVVMMSFGTRAPGLPVPALS